MIKNNWAAWFENEPKYKKGDVVLVADLLRYYVAQITDVRVAPRNKKQKDDIEKHIAERKPCCGGQGRGIRTENNIIKYNGIQDKEVEEINEVRIIGGIDKINEHIKSLDNQISNYSEQRAKAAEALGYDTW